MQAIAFHSGFSFYLHFQCSQLYSAVLIWFLHVLPALKMSLLSLISNMDFATPTTNLKLMLCSLLSLTHILRNTHINCDSRLLKALLPGWTLLMILIIGYPSNYQQEWTVIVEMSLKEVKFLESWLKLNWKFFIMYKEKVENYLCSCMVQPGKTSSAND